MAQKINKKQLFRGFSSYGRINPKTEIVDIELIKRDLLNHFHTIKGERVMRPDFGSIIWDLLFEPFDSDVRDAIVSDAQDIIAQEPRVERQNIEVFEFEHGIRIDIDLLYTPFNAVDTLEVNFDRRNYIGTSEQING